MPFSEGVSAIANGILPVASGFPSAASDPELSVALYAEIVASPCAAKYRTAVLMLVELVALREVQAVSPSMAAARHVNKPILIPAFSPELRRVVSYTNVYQECCRKGNRATPGRRLVSSKVSREKLP